MFKDVYIVSAARTAVGNFGGSLRDVSAIELGTITAKEALKRAGLTGAEIDEVIFGNVGQYGLNAFLARLVSLNAGIPNAATAQTVNRMCASGLQAVVTGEEMNPALEPMLPGVDAPAVMRFPLAQGVVHRLNGLSCNAILRPAYFTRQRQLGALDFVMAELVAA